MELDLQEIVGERWREKRYLLAVSGGADSMAMLGLFAEALPPARLIVAHFDHRVRKDSSRSRDLVRDVARELGLRFVEGARAGKGASEAALRTERRAFLEGLLEEEAFDWIVTAHHAQDQLETLLMRLIRGTGMQGLKGIAPRNGKWLRPFLSSTKEELNTFRKRRGIPMHRDSTNLSRRYFRNRVRQDLVPAFLTLSEAHGGMKKVSAKLAGLTEEIRQWDRQERKRLARKADAHLIRTAYWYRWPEAAWRRLSRPQRARWMRAIVEELSGQAPTRAGVAGFLNAIENRQPRFQGENRVEILFSCEQIFIQSEPQRNRLRDAKRLGVSENFRPERGDLRYWRPGDRFRGKKLKELLLEKRIPRPERHLLPVIAVPQSSEVLWYFGEPGFTLSGFEFPFSHSTKSDENSAL